MRVSEVLSGRDNNFNLIRMLAAFGVIVSHSYPLTRGPKSYQPEFGDLAVDVFFVISGFLVTRSLMTRQDTWSFARARILRIYPALWVMLCLAVFVLGPAVSSVSFLHYFATRMTYGYLAKDAILFSGINYSLPGVFTANAFPQAVNGSLWTLYYEVRLYMSLALVWMILKLLPDKRLYLFPQFILAAVAISLTIRLVLVAHGETNSEWSRLATYFLFGSAMYVLRDRIILSWISFAGLLVALGVAAYFGGKIFVLGRILLLGWLTLHFAYLPQGWIRQYNRLGDYSYGLYIYAFPVQQTIDHFYPQITVPAMLASASIATTILAMLSWHWIEKPALSRRTLRQRRPPTFDKPPS